MMYKKMCKTISRSVVGTIAGLSLINGLAPAGEVTVAVAANFTEAAKEIGALFEKTSGHKAVFSFASTGTLYTQISQGAPYQVFLAADQKHPEKAIGEGFAIAQDAVLLQRGADNPAAAAFLDFLKGPEAAKVKARFGYGTGN